MTRHRSAVCHLGGVSRRVRVGDTFEIPHLGGSLRVEVIAIEALGHVDEESGYTWNTWRAVLRPAERAEVAR